MLGLEFNFQMESNTKPQYKFWLKKKYMRDFSTHAYSASMWTHPLLSANPEGKGMELYGPVNNSLRMTDLV